MKRTAFKSFAVVSALSVFVSCGTKRNQEESTETKVPVSSENHVTNNNACVNRVIGSESTSYQIVNACGLEKQSSSSALAELKKSAPLMSPEEQSNAQPSQQAASVATRDDSLLVGFPIKKLGSEFMFGAVFTKVSAKDDETLGRLKLTNLDALHVRPFVARDQDDKLYLGLSGCISKCGETSKVENLVFIPIAGINQDQTSLFLDVSALGKELDLIGIMDPDGTGLKLKVKAVAATAADFSTDTLVFDIEDTANRVPNLLDALNALAQGRVPTEDEEDIKITARWYLKETSGLNTAFKSRAPVDGVGFFGTSRNESELINRFSIAPTPTGAAPIHYYIKNVPKEWQKAFANSYEQWNGVFTSITGGNKISYEFVAADDPSADLLVPGDPRANILEWDLVNVAPYGGLGPSLASQTTGETFAAHVLIQGPTIIKLYTTWFKVNQQAAQLRAQGQTAAAEKLLAETANQLTKQSQPADIKFQATLGKKNIKLAVPSEDKRLMDRLAARTDFVPIPDGVTYESYMNGYFLDMVTHEMGHNLGLRHNFRGNLFYDEEKKEVSASVMEYLNKSFRHLDHAGPYDLMALEYGYAGKKPTRLDMFCTDENVADPTDPDADLSTFNPECSRDDATDDPFGYLEKEATRAVDLLVNRGSTDAPTWKWEDVASFMKTFTTPMMVYITGAEKTSAQWTNWQPKFGRPRPTDAAAIKAYAIDHIKALQCRPAVLGAEAQKSTAEGKELVRNNLAALKEFMQSQAGAFKLDTAIFDCGN